VVLLKQRVETIETTENREVDVLSQVSLAGVAETALVLRRAALRMDFETLGVAAASLSRLGVLCTTGGVFSTDSMAELTTEQ